MMKNGPIRQLPQQGSDDAAVEAMIALLGELIEVIEAENRLLDRGLPASISNFVDRKTRLSGAFEDCVADVKSQKVQIARVTPARREQLIERTRLLGAITGENLERLRLAMDASQRRINAIMTAIREQVVQPGYGANGLHHGAAANTSVLGAQLKI